jgi:hypothetical protein
MQRKGNFAVQPRKRRIFSENSGRLAQKTPPSEVLIEQTELSG